MISNSQLGLALLTSHEQAPRAQKTIPLDTKTAGNDATTEDVDIRSFNEIYFPTFDTEVH